MPRPCTAAPLPRVEPGVCWFAGTRHLFIGSSGEGLVRGIGKAMIAVEDLTTKRAVVTCETGVGVQAARYSVSSEKETSFGYPISSVFRHGPLLKCDWSVRI
jgi:hypothetical protein